MITWTYWFIPETWRYHIASLKINRWKTILSCLGQFSANFFRCKIGTLSVSGKFIKRPQTPQQSQPPSSCLYFSNWVKGVCFLIYTCNPSYLKKRSFFNEGISMKIRNSKLDRIRYRPGWEILSWDYLDHINPENELFSIIYRYARYRWCPRTLGSLLQRFWLFAALYPNSTKLEGSQAIKRLTMSQCLCQNDSSSKWIKMDDFRVVTRGHTRFCQVLCGSEGRG